MQATNAAGEVIDIYPYRQEQRFERRFSAPARSRD